jgi:hypothetical protein
LIALTIGHAEIERLLSFLQSDYSNALAKVWESGGMTNAVFVQTEWAYRMVEHTITIVMQYHTDRHECDLTIVASGNARASPIGMRMRGLSEATESTFMERIKNLAVRHGWEINGSSFDYVGFECPYCGAYYSYKKSHMLEDGSVRCQNCDRSFLLTKAQESEALEERLV